MIFQTNNDNTGIITFLQARKLAEQELTAMIRQKQAILTMDTVALKTYEVEVAKGTVSTERFAVIMKGASTEAQNYAVSTKGATGSTQAFVTNQQKTINALKNTEKASLSASLGVKALNIALNMGAMLAFSLAVKAVTWAVDTAITTLEEQKEKVGECASAYESAQTELSSITSELETQTQVMNDLLAKDKLTYTEKGQLEELRQTTKELQIQKDIAGKKEAQSQKALAVESAKLINKQYGTETASIDKINEYQLYNDGMIGKLITDPDDLSIMIAGYREINEALEEAYSSNNEDDIEHFKDLTDEVATSIWNTITSLTEQQKNMQSYYDTIKDTPYEQLTSDQKSVIDAYRKTANEIKLVYSELFPEEWNDMEISNIFNSDGIEKTKDELIEMAQSGELTPETIASYKNLNGAISSSEIFLKNGQTAAQAFCDEIYACAEAKDDLDSGNGNETPIFPISDTIDQLNTQLKPAFDSLKSAYEDIFTTDKDGNELFTLKDVDISMLDNIKSSLDDLNEIAGITIDYSPFEQLASVLTNVNSTEEEVKNGFNSLATEIINGLNPSLSSIDGSMYQFIQRILESVGILNSEEILIQSLGYSYQEYTNAKQAAAAAGINLENATLSTIQQLIEEGRVAGEDAQALIDYYIQKSIASGSTVDTLSTVNELIQEFDQLGLNCDKLREYRNLKGKSLEGGSTFGKGSGNYEPNITKEPKKKVNVEYAAPKSSGSKSGGSSSTDAYLEEYKRKQAELKHQREMDLISEAEYQKKSMDLADEYLKGKEKYLEEYRSVEEKYYQYTRDLNKKVMDEVQSGVDDIQSAYKSLGDISKELNKNGKISIDSAQELGKMDFRFLASLESENGLLSVNEQAFSDLAMAKINEMQITQARMAIDTINNLTNEAKATEYLTNANKELAGESLSATESMLQMAVANAKMRGEAQGQAADMILKGYQNAKQLIGQTDFNLNAKVNTDGEGKEDSFSKAFDWTEKLLEKLEKITSKILDKVDKFYSWQKKNLYINKAIKSTQKEIHTNDKSYDFYMKKAEKTGLSAKYKNLVQNGDIKYQEITDEGLSKKIEQYEEWYQKAQDCLDKIEDLYDQERDLIRQKLDNVIDYFSELDSYLSSITGKFDSLISLNDSMGKRSSLTELVEQFASVNEQLNTIEGTMSEVKNGTADTIYGVDSDTAKEMVSEGTGTGFESEKEKLQKKLSEMESSVTTHGTYQQFLKKIESTKEKLEKLDAKGYNTLTKAQKKTYDKLTAQLEDYNKEKEALENNATSATLTQYKKLYEKLKPLQDKIDGGKSLTKAQQKNYDSYKEQLESLSNAKSAQMKEIQSQLEELEQSKDKTEAEKAMEKAQKDRDNYQNEVKNTATYQALEKSIASKEADIQKLLSDNGLTVDEDGNLSGLEGLKKSKQKSVQKQFEKLSKAVRDYYAEKQALEDGATAANIANFDRIYKKWKELDDKINSGKTLSKKEWLNYQDYEKQLKELQSQKQEELQKLSDAIDLSKVSSKEDQINLTYEQAKKELDESYQDQYKNAKDHVKNTQTYQSLKAEIEKLEAEKEKKGNQFKKDDLLNDKKAALEALEKGGTAENAAEYLKIYNAYLKELDKKKPDAGKLDEYKAKLDAWDKVKQGQLTAIMDEWEDALQNIASERESSLADAESDLNEYYGKLYEYAKQIAEYELSAIDAQIGRLESEIGVYEKLLNLYQNASRDALISAGYLDAEDTSSMQEMITKQAEGYEQALKEKYDALLKKKAEYENLLNALDTNDFGSSMDIFNSFMEDDSVSEEVKKKLQSVIDLLDERSVDSASWGEYADLWENEWTSAFNEVKQEIIDTVGDMEEFKNTFRETIVFKPFNDLIEKLDSIQGKFSSLAGIIEDDWTFDKNGITEYGLAKVSLLAKQLSGAQDEVSGIAEHIQDIMNTASDGSTLDSYLSDEAKQAALNEAYEQYASAISDAYSIQKQIYDLAKKTQEQELDGLKNLIEKRKESLQAKKSYYDYDKTIREKNKDIQALKAQIEALNDVDTAESKAKKAALETQLDEAAKDLSDTKSEHEYNIQIQSLDDLISRMEEALNDSTKDIASTFEDFASALKDILGKAEGVDSSSLLNDIINGVILNQNLTNDVKTDFNSIVNTPVASSGETFPQLELDTKNVEKTKDENELVVFKSLDSNVKTLVDRMKENNNFITSNLDVIGNIDSSLNKWLDLWKNNSNNMVVQKPVELNINYENMINVEGNVDKNFAPDMKKIVNEAYKYTAQQMCAELRKMGYAPMR